MTEIKSRDIEALLRKPVDRFSIFLIHGTDRGLVSERAGLIAAKTGVSLDDPFSVVKLDAGSLQQSPGRFPDEVNAISLFGGKRLIWVRGAASEKSVMDGLATIARSLPPDVVVIIEAGDIKKTNALRKLAEAEGAIASIACYPDDRRALNELISSEIEAAGLSITEAARQRLLEGLGGDRIASRNEVQKLIVYRMGAGTIEESHVLEIIGDASAISVDEAVDAVLTGDVDALQRAVMRIFSSKTAGFLALNACLKQFQLMETLRAEMDEHRSTPQDVVANHARHLHFSRKPLVEAALRRWQLPSIRRECNRLQAAILQSRMKSMLEESIIMQTLLAITLQSRGRVQ